MASWGVPTACKKQIVSGRPVRPMSEARQRLWWGSVSEFQPVSSRLVPYSFSLGPPARCPFIDSFLVGRVPLLK